MSIGRSQRATAQPERAWTRALERAWHARRRRLAGEALASWLGACLPGFGVLFVVALLAPPSRVSSGLLAGAALAWTLATLVGWGLRPLLRMPDLAAYALWLERRAGLARNELANALDLERDMRWGGSAISRDLVAIALERARGLLQGLPLGRLHAERPLWPAARSALLGLTPILLAWALLPGRSGEALRLVLAAGRPIALPELALEVEPGDASLERGAGVAIHATLAGRRLPGEATLSVRRPGGSWNRLPMEREEGASTASVERFRRELPALEGEVEYRVRAGWAESRLYRLSVLEPLQALGYRLRYESPEYTGIPPRSEAALGGDIDALAGTRVTLEVTHRRPGAAGELGFDDGSTLALRPAGDGALAGAWSVTRAGRYCVRLRDPGTGQAWQSDSFSVALTADLAPVVELRQPPPAIRMPPDMQVSLEIEALDDFGLTELALIYGRSEDDPTRVALQRWPARGAPREARLRYAWDLGEVQVLPGQEIYYYLQVLDNDPLGGPKTGETPLCTIRFPSVGEMYAHAEEERRDEIRALEETLRHQTDLQQDLEQVAQELKADPRVSWERQQEIEGLLERQQELSSKVEQIQQSLSQSQQRMENQNLFSTEVLEKVREIQELVAEVQSPEFKAALDRMRQAMESLDRRELQRAMQQLQVTQEEVSQALDRTLAMLKRLLANEQIDRMQQQLAELEARQAEVNRQLEEGSPQDSTRALSPSERGELGAQQEALEKQLAELKQRLADLARQSAEMPDLKQALEQLLAQPAGQEATEQMQKALEAMQQSDRSDALKFGRKARSGLQQMHASMQQMMMDTEAERLEAIARSLYAVSNRLVAASQREEELLGEIAALGPRELALRQQEVIEEVRQIGDSLVAISRLTPYVGRTQLRHLGEALERIENGRDAFNEGRRSVGEALLGEAMRGLNATTVALLEAANQCSQSACNMSCPSPFHRLQTLSGQQQCLNQDTQQMIGACQTPRLTAGQQESLMRLAARQEMIRQGLQEIQGELEGSGKLMGDAGRMIEEMEEAVRELQARRADPRVIQRQERILSRLLNAQRSLRRQDENEERLSRTGVDPASRVSPLAVDEGDPAGDRLRRALLRGRQDPVPSEYRRWVEAYLRALVRGR